MLGGDRRQRGRQRPSGPSKGYAYVVRFSSNGEAQEIVQGADVYIAPGTPVDIIAGADGWKLIPRGGVLGRAPSQAEAGAENLTTRTCRAALCGRRVPI